MANVCLIAIDFKHTNIIFIEQVPLTATFCYLQDNRAESKYDPKKIILTFFIKGHQMMLHAKYECSSPYGLSQEDFKRFPSLILCKIVCPQAEPK